MIYVTVGTQLPFDRLISSVNQWASNHNESVFAQVGPSKLEFPSIVSCAFITPNVADEKIREADLVIAHAGMGTIITATQYGKPLIIMPRQLKFGEHRNDHQISTAERFSNFQNIVVVNSSEELNDALNGFFSGILKLHSEKTSSYAPDEFINEIRKLLL